MNSPKSASCRTLTRVSVPLRLKPLIEDCGQTLSSDVSDQFDREANVFASEVLFQLDSFAREAGDFDFGINVPIKLHEKYGASIYASIRQYVSKSPRACVVLILNPPEFKAGDGFIASLRRVVSSDSFDEKIGAINWPKTFTPDDKIGATIPINRRRMSGKQEISITNSDRECYECIAQAFTQTYQVFILIHLVQTLTKTTIVLPTFTYTHH